MKIKDVETQAIARQLAAATGESVTLAVTTAIRERLQRERKSKILRLAAEIRANAGSGPWPDHGDLLYGPDDRLFPA